VSDLKRFILIPLILLLAALSHSQTTIAVIDFDARDISASEVATLTDRFRDELTKTNQYTVIERGKMEEVLREQGFQQSGCSSDECVVEVGQLIGDIKVGRWTYYHNNGRIQQIGSYRNNMQIGQWAYFYADGRKEKEGYFVDNILENHWSYFYPNGQKEKEGSYNVGEIDGQWTYYYSNGNIKKEGSYSSGKVDGEWKYYFQLGKKEKEGIYKNGKKNGRWIYFLKNGKISMEGSYVLNNKEGKWIVNHWGDKYFDSGHFIKDRKHGEWIRTNESSDTISVTFYKKGLLREAIFSIISKGGTIISVNCKIEYSNTLFHIKAASNGTLIEYYPSGQKKAEVFIKNYLVHGRRTNYDMEGKSMNYNDFFKGEGFYVNYYPNRILAMQGNCINFDGYSMIKVGKWAYADSSGKNVEYIIYDDEGNEIIE